MVSAAPKSCIFKDTHIGYHMPYLQIGDYKLDLPLSQARITLSYVGSHLSKWGVPKEDIMWVNYVSMMTPSDTLTSLVGIEASLVLKDVYWCEDLVEDSE